MTETEEKKKPICYYSRVRELLRGNYNNEDVRLNIAGDAKEPFLKWLEDLIKEACDSIVEGMPHKSKGEQEGQLSRKTVKKADIKAGQKKFGEHYEKKKK
ncbi:MAG: hypothetical protein ACFFD2_07065 [Promethearchaeota archaeon]